jgi:two-component system, cell cycle sensor histidine kinase and response regulator CckA
VFTIYLPRLDAGVKHGHGQELEPVPASLRGTETVLVVDDQEQLLKLAGTVLRRYGYRVLEAANPGKGLPHCERYCGAIHLLLTDIVMSGMMGPELANRLRQFAPCDGSSFHVRLQWARDCGPN